MARGCVRCTWGPSLVPKAVPSRVCVYSALRREVSGGRAAGTASNCNCTACHFLAGIETGLKEKGIKRLQSRLEREREKERKKGKKEEGRSPVVPTGLQHRPETPELTGSRTQWLQVPGPAPPRLPIDPRGEVSSSPATSCNLQFCREPGGRSMHGRASQNRSAHLDTPDGPGGVAPRGVGYTRWVGARQGLRLHPHAQARCTELWVWLGAG